MYVHTQVVHNLTADALPGTPVACCSLSRGKAVRQEHVLQHQTSKVNMVSTKKQVKLIPSDISDKEKGCVRRNKGGLQTWGDCEERQGLVANVAPIPYESTAC